MYFETNIWEQKISNANKYYKEWESLFDIKQLERYFEGFQWRGLFQMNSAYRPYQLNLIFSTIKTKQAATLIKNPQFKVNPTPGNSDWNQQEAVDSATLKQDMINAMISNPNIEFDGNAELVSLDSYFRFGIWEINYAADWNNPQKQPIITTEWDDLNVDPEQAKKVEDVPLPENEKVFYKHIKASRFRVSTSDSPMLSNCSWCGYWMPVYESTLRNTKGIKFPTGYSFGERLGIGSSKNLGKSAAMGSARVCKVWKIWDNERKVQLLFLDGYFQESLNAKEITFEHLPFEDLVWNKRAPGAEDNETGYYPIPPVFNWISPQDEINQAREQMRNYRRRYTRKFQIVGNKVDQEEIEKFKNEVDGEIVTVKQQNAITPIENPQIGPTITGDLQVANDDFNKIAGVSQVQQSDRTTATQSKINADRETIREDTEEEQYKKFLGRSGRKGLLIAREKFSVGMWVKYTQDPGDDMFGEYKEAGTTYKFVSSQDLEDGYDFTVVLNVVEKSQDEQMEDQNKYITFLKILQAFPMISMSPTMITETAYICGYRNTKVLKALQQAALVNMVGMAAQGQQGAQQQGFGNAAQGSMNANSNPNPGSEIDTQLQGQLQ